MVLFDYFTCRLHPRRARESRVTSASFLSLTGRCCAQESKTVTAGTADLSTLYTPLPTGVKPDADEDEDDDGTAFLERLNAISKTVRERFDFISLYVL